MAQTGHPLFTPTTPDVKMEQLDEPELSSDSPLDAMESEMMTQQPSWEEHSDNELSQQQSSEEPTIKEVTEKSARKKVTERKFVCVVCGKGFLHFGHLKRHLKLHSDKDLPPGSHPVESSAVHPDLPIVDDASEAVIVQPDIPLLNSSISETIEESQPVIDNTGLLMVQPELTLTALKQTISRNFICVLCGKGFGRNSHLKRHMKLHTTPGLEVPEPSIMKAGSLILQAGLTSGNDKPEAVTERAKSPIFVDPSKTIQVKSEPLAISDPPDSLLFETQPPSTVDSFEARPPSSVDSFEARPPSSVASLESVVVKTESPIIDSYGTLDEQTGSPQISDISANQMESSEEQLITSDGNSEASSDKWDLSLSILNKMNPNRDKPLLCAICGKAFRRKSHLTRHVKLHTNLEFHDCEICGKRFLQSAYLRAHVNTVHAAVKEELEKVYGCATCAKQFGRMSHLKRHMKLHIGGQTYDCSVCGKSFLQNSNLKSHEKSHADLVISIDEGLIKRHVNEETNTEYFDCEQCGKSFQQISSLKAHINTVHVGPKIFAKSFECSFCGKQFGRNSHLKRHMKLHVGGKTYTCELCGRIFMQNGNLKAHIRMVHLKERSHQCTICGKMFLQQSNLNTHIRTHTGEKPYECTVCGKDFTQGNQLKYHMRTHFGETPFSCKICGKTFTNNRSCKRHMKTHTGDKPFECGICHKNFYQGNQLKAHMRTHTGEKPYTCPICGKEFTNNRGRNRHVLAHSVSPDKLDSDTSRSSRDSEDFIGGSDGGGDIDDMMILGDIKEEVEAVVKEEPEISDYESDYVSNEDDAHLDHVSTGEVYQESSKPIDEEQLHHQRNVIQSVNEAIKDLTKGKVDSYPRNDQVEGDLLMEVSSNEDYNVTVEDHFENDIQGNQTGSGILPCIALVEDDVIEEDPLADV